MYRRFPTFVPANLDEFVICIGLTLKLDIIFKVELSCETDYTYLIIHEYFADGFLSFLFSMGFI